MVFSVFVYVRFEAEGTAAGVHSLWTPAAVPSATHEVSLGR